MVVNHRHRRVSEANERRPLGIVVLFADEAKKLVQSVRRAREGD
jgi:hypothetical protein